MENRVSFEKWTRKSLFAAWQERITIFLHTKNLGKSTQQVHLTVDDREQSIKTVATNCTISSDNANTTSARAVTMPQFGYTSGKFG